MKSMKFGVIAAAVSMAVASVASAAPFTPGNVAIYRVGTGTGALSNASTAVFVDEYTPAGTLVQSIAMPTAVSGSNRVLTASGTATSEGFLTLSADGRFLMLTGYDSTPGFVGVATSTSATVSRVVGRIDAAGNVDTTTALGNVASANNIRSVASTNGTDIWVGSANNGVSYTTLGSTTATTINTGLTNVRNVTIQGGQLYLSTSSGSAFRIASVGTGTPTTAGQTLTALPSFPLTGSPYAYFFADLSTAVAGVDTLYVADDSAFGLRKYSLVSGAWALNGTIGAAADAYRGLTGTVNGDGSVSLFATRQASQLVSLVDSSGFNGAFSGTPTLLATAATNTAFRGVAFAVPEPAALGLLAPVCAMLGGRRRR